MNLTESNIHSLDGPKSHQIHRRDLFKIVAVGAFSLAAIGCKKNILTDSNNPEVNPGNRIDLAATNDLGILNYIYALEQLEAAFYIKACESFPVDFTDVQKVYFNELKLHEQTHVDYLASIIGIQAAIGKLEFNFSSIDFSSKTAVLLTAQTFEDLGVAAYNGALERAGGITAISILSQIATVEARHAAWARNQVADGSSISLDLLVQLGANASQATDVSLSPVAVLQEASKYIKTKLEIVNA